MTYQLRVFSAKGTLGTLAFLVTSAWLNPKFVAFDQRIENRQQFSDRGSIASVGRE